MKKKAALGTTALAVLASTIPAQVAPVHAEELMMEVHTKYNSGGSNTAHTGNGTEGSPFNLFEDAIAKVAPGGTIIIHDEAFLNEVTQNNLPFLINKNITIKSVTGKHATLEVRTPGIILGDDVKFENINLEFTNKHHDAIFVNGHTLDLINVTRSTGTREIDLFAGTLYTQLNGQPVHTPGDKSVINVESNGQFLGESLESKFGNIYAGSMNGDFNADAEINVSRKDSSKKLVVGAIYGSGALEADPGHMLDTREPLAPEAKPDNFKMYGNVNVTLNNYQVPVDGNTGTDSSTTSVSTNSVYKSDLALTDVHSLEVTSGEVNLVSFSGKSLSHIPNVKLANGAVLGFGGVSGNFNVDTFEGNGTVVLRTTGKLNIANPVAQGNSINLAIQEYFNNASGKAYLEEGDPVHITSPKGANVTFTPHSTQSYLTVHPVEKDGRLEWTVMDKKKVPATPVQPEPEVPTEPDTEVGLPELPTINAFNIEAANANIVKSVDDFEGNNLAIEYPFTVDAEEGFSLIESKDLDITVGGHKAKHTDNGYYVEEHKMLITLEPSESGYKMVTKFDDVPTEGTYNIKLAVGDVALNTSLTINGKEGNKVTAFKGYEETKTVAFANAGTVKFPFTVETSLEEELDFPNAETTLLVNNNRAEFNADTKTFTVDGMTLAVNHIEDKSYELVVTSQTVKSGLYGIQLVSGDVALNTNLFIEAAPAKEYKTFYFDKLSIGGLSKSSSYSNGGSSKPVVNTNTSGKPISVLIDGEPREFTKGYSAFGNSKIVLDARFGDTKTYTRAVGRLGIDSSQINQGNGVDVKVYQGSPAPGTVKLVHEFKNVTADKDAIYLDLDLATNGYYLEFHVSNKGNDTGDMFVLADFKLVETDYKEEVKDTKITGLKRLADYDAILREKTPEENLTQNKMVILQREFVNKVGYQTVKAIAETSPEYAQAIEFLMNSEVALENLITGGPASKEGSYTNAIRHFCDIYKAHGEDFENPADNYFNLRLGISTALVYANPTLATSWYGSSFNTNPVNRYEAYQRLVNEGYMDEGGANDTGFGKWSTEQFKDLPVPLMRWVVGNRINNDEIFWLADYALKHKELKRNYLDAYNYIAYLDYNYADPEMYKLENKDKYNEKHGNFSKYFDNYGTNGLVRLWMVFEEGAVCGGLSKTYHNLATTFGRPSSVMGQPGHAAAMTYGWNTTTQRYEWQIQNDIYGWAQSGNEYNDRLLNWGNKSWTIWHNASYNVLATDAVLQTDKYMKATMLNLLANSYESKESIYTDALATQSINLESMEGLINAYKADPSKTSGDYLQLAKRIIDTYTYYPQVMMEMLALLDGKLTDDGDAVQLDILKNNALMSASKATPDKSTNVTMTKQLADKYLNGNDFGAVATFSFDGENAGKIVLNPKYGESQITLEYSLDGGNKWIQTKDKVITLTKEELASITAENDIKISLVGVDTVHTIDILAGQATTGKVTANDFENLLIGTTTNLEFSLDGGLTWCDYVTDQEDTINPNGLTGIRFNKEEEQRVSIRYKANGVYLAGEVQEFKFTPNTDIETKKYVQLREVNVISAPQHQSGREPKYAINGNDIDNGFHTKFGTTTKDKVMTFEFSTPKYITSMDYLFGGGNNGRMKKGTIQASLDGQTWEVIKTFENMLANVASQEYVMDKVVKAKFIKIVADETHGNSTGQQNMFLAVSDLRFYEDITKLEVVPTPVPPTPVYPQEPTPSQPGAGDNSGIVGQPVGPPVAPPTAGDDEPSTKPPVQEEVQKPSTGGQDGNISSQPSNGTDTNKPSTDTGGDASTSKPSTGTDTSKPSSTPSTDTGSSQPSTGTDTNKPSTGTGGDASTSKPSTGTDTSKPSSTPSTGTDSSQPSTGGNTSSAPSTGGGGSVIPPSSNTGGSSTPPVQEEQKPATPPTTDKEEEKPSTPPTVDKEDYFSTNQVEKLEELPKDLQEKVDSIIASTVTTESELYLSIAGDKEDIKYVSSLEVTKEGVFANVEGEKVKFDLDLDLDNIDWDNYRVVRMNKSGNGFSAVPHKSTGEGFKISSGNLEDIIITAKVSIPFKDVDKTDWFKADVEEMYNYGFTTGTTAETFSPYDNITRGQFAAMIARALELTPTSKKNNLADTKGKWYADDAQALFDAGIIKGFSDGTFGGEQKLTRQQAATMITNMLKYAGVDTKVTDKVDFKDIDKVSEGAQDAVKFLASKDVLVSGEEVNFNSSNNITRAQMSKLLIRSLHLTDLY